jgi:hypothetical protein
LRIIFFPAPQAFAASLGSKGLKDYVDQFGTAANQSNNGP